jgi:competence protein ComEC
MRRWAWFLAVTLILSLWGLPLILPQPARLWVLSVGQGESVLYRDQSGKYLLFDGGPDDTVLSELGRVLPPWQRIIHVAVLSHTHADHLRGLISVLDRYTVLEAWESGSRADGEDVARWRQQLADQKISRTLVRAGQRHQLGHTSILALFPLQSMDGKRVRDAHDANIVLQLINGSHRILLTGDLDERHEKAILGWCRPPACTLHSQILQVPHHGSGYGLLPAFLVAVDPKLAFIPVGQKNRFRHPHPTTLQKLGDQQITYHRTDTQGGLVITFLRDRFSFRSSGSPPR